MPQLRRKAQIPPTLPVNGFINAVQHHQKWAVVDIVGAQVLVYLRRPDIGVTWPLCPHITQFAQSGAKDTQARTLAGGTKADADRQKHDSGALLSNNLHGPVSQQCRFPST